MTTPTEDDEVPYEVKACARCRSTEIQRKEGFHPLGRWECRDCGRAFMVPGVQIRLLPAGQEPPSNWHLG